MSRPLTTHLGTKALLALGAFIWLPPGALAPGLRHHGRGADRGGVAAGRVGFLLPDVALHREAETRRRDFRHVTGAFLDLVAMNLAGGRGLPEALLAASSFGDHWAMVRIRQALSSARLMGWTPWEGIAQLGRDLGIDELRDLAAALALAGDEGARDPALAVGAGREHAPQGARRRRGCGRRELPVDADGAAAHVCRFLGILGISGNQPHPARVRLLGSPCSPLMFHALMLHYARARAGRRREDECSSAIEWAIISAVVVIAAVVIGGIVYTIVNNKKDIIQQCGAVAPTTPTPTADRSCDTGQLRTFRRRRQRHQRDRARDPGAAAARAHLRDHPDRAVGVRAQRRAAGRQEGVSQIRLIQPSDPNADQEVAPRSPTPPGTRAGSAARACSDRRWQPPVFDTPELGVPSKVTVSVTGHVISLVPGSALHGHPLRQWRAQRFRAGA